MSANTKENTVRIIKGQQPVQQLKCRLGWHRWTAWEHSNSADPFSGRVVTCVCADCNLLRVEPAYTKYHRKNK